MAIKRLYFIFSIWFSLFEGYSQESLFIKGDTLVSKERVHHNILVTTESAMQYTRIIDSSGNFYFMTGHIRPEDLNENMLEVSFKDKSVLKTVYNLENDDDSIKFFYSPKRNMKEGSVNHSALIADITFNEILNVLNEDLDSNLLYLVYEVVKLNKNKEQDKRDNLSRRFIVEKLKYNGKQNEHNFYQYYIESIDYSGLKLKDTNSYLVPLKEVNKIVNSIEQTAKLIESNEYCITHSPPYLIIVGGIPFISTWDCSLKNRNKDYKNISDFEGKLFFIKNSDSFLKEKGLSFKMY